MCLGLSKSGLGIDETGKKHVLGLREGSTENATLCRELFASLVERGLPQDRHLLFVIDGGKEELPHNREGKLA